MGNVYRKKDLDNIQMLMRKGNLRINPRRIRIGHDFVLVPVTIPAGADKDDYDDGLTLHQLCMEKPAKDELDDDEKKVWKLARENPKVKFKAEPSYSWRGRESGIEFHSSLGRSTRKSMITYYDRGKEGWTSRGDLRKGVADWIPAEMKKKRTLVGWLQFMRKVRKHLRKCMNEGLMDAMIRRCDWLMEHKDHDLIKEKIISGMARLREITAPFRQTAEAMVEDLDPFIKVEPYDSVRSHLANIASNIEYLDGYMSEIESDLGLKKGEEDE